MSTPFVYGMTWAVDAGERALKTAAQAVLLALGASDTGMGNFFEFDFGTAGGFALGGFVISVLTSIISAPIGGSGTASVVPAPPGPAATE